MLFGQAKSLLFPFTSHRHMFLILSDVISDWQDLKEAWLTQFLDGSLSRAERTQGTSLPSRLGSATFTVGDRKPERLPSLNV